MSKEVEPFNIGILIENKDTKSAVKISLSWDGEDYTYEQDVANNVKIDLEKDVAFLGVLQAIKDVLTEE